MDAKQHAAAAFSNAQQAAQQLANFLAPGEWQGVGRCLDDCAKYVGLAQSHAHAAAATAPSWDPDFTPLDGQPPAQHDANDMGTPAAKIKPSKAPIEVVDDDDEKDLAQLIPHSRPGGQRP